MTDIKDCFSTTMNGARTRFLEACDRAYIHVTALPGSATGTEDDRKTAYADVTRFGSPSAGNVLMLAPADGGPSTFISAGILTAVVSERLYKHLPRDLALVILHAVNPKGPLWPPAGPDAPSLPEDWDDAMLARAESRYRNQHKERPFSRRELAGLTLADVVTPAWSKTDIRLLADQMLEDCDRLHLLEVGEMKGKAGEYSLEADKNRTWIPEDYLKAAKPLPENTCPLAAHLMEEAGIPVCSAAQIRFGAAPPPQIRDKNKGSFIPGQEQVWQPQIWEAASGLISGIMMSFRD